MRKGAREVSKISTGTSPTVLKPAGPTTPAAVRAGSRADRTRTESSGQTLSRQALGSSTGITKKLCRNKVVTGVALLMYSPRTIRTGPKKPARGAVTNVWLSSLTSS